jgi:hypothetical protein
VLSKKTTIHSEAVSWSDFKKNLDDLQAGTLAAGADQESFLLAGLQAHIEDLEQAGKPITAALIRETMKRYRTLCAKVIELQMRADDLDAAVKAVGGIH